MRDDGTVDPSFGQAGARELPPGLGLPTAFAVTADARVRGTIAIAIAGTVEKPSIEIDRRGRLWIAVVTYKGERFITHVFAFTPDGCRVRSFGTRGRTDIAARRVWDLVLDHDRPLLGANVDWSGLAPPPSGYGVLMRLRRLPR